VEGRVADDNQNTLILADGTSVRAYLGPRKDPGIEAPVVTLTLPSPGSTVRIRGIFAGGAIYPLAPGDMQVLRSANENLLVKLLIWLAIAAAAGILTYVIIRLISHPSKLARP
jgi:hypothetical protein